VSTFVDSSAFYAASDADDASHTRMRAALAGERDLVTTDHVLVETWLLIHGRSGGHFADLFWEAIRRGPARVEQTTAADLEAAWRIGAAFPDQGFSIVDRTSFAVMERLGISRVASLDAHFPFYRYGPRRERAFEVVR